jgi:hypothetical protein
MYDSARRWIKYDVADGTQLAIVKFRYLISLLALIISYQVFFLICMLLFTATKQPFSAV